MPGATLPLVMDSAREFSQYGRMRVRDNRITTAMVNEYFGYELKDLPNYVALGLEPERKYRLLRCPDELAKAVESFKGIPLLEGHVADSAENPRKQERCGVVCDDVRFDYPHLIGSLVLWDNDAIAGVETEEQRQLSASYGYTLDMTPGEFEGEPYDGVMRNIVGNHVAIVPVGRVPGAVINDEKPEGLETVSKEDDNKKPEGTVYDSAEEAVRGVLTERGMVGDDGEVDGDLLEGLLSAIASVAPANDNDPGGEKPEKNDNPSGTANDALPKPLMMDAAAIRTQVEKEVTAKFSALRRAERECEPLIGAVACDSAEEVYRMTLTQHGVEGADTVHASALPHMVAMLKSRQQAMANDAQPEMPSASQAEKFSDYFGGQ
ncbi:TPA: DUF2213 domain-containing protein [Salmonella enterica]|nr:DUF2213 domain-containing protein [Salmonella enterica]MCH5739614.1 DUF2213 domain-containing protein [Salmonella enterica]MCH5744708.1 DUF2213 domain-containing protein [Salmonella enterica]MCH5749667.1 DUF2213 domain-containing protein [Salmonella enterica]MCH5757159.1 DUF2213 domain-containing protein [Salmonella enterica]